MRQMIRILLGMLLLTSISAFADSFTGQGVNFNVQPNNGSGGNIGGLISGQGVNFLAGWGNCLLLAQWFPGSYLSTKGQDFTISVPVSLDIITGTILATCSNVCQTVSLTTTAGTRTLSFFYSAADGMYYGTSGSFTSAAVVTVPEPGTLGLMVMSVVAVTRRRLQQRRA